MEHRPVDDPASYRLKKLGMRKTIEVAAYICVDNFSMASIDQLVDLSHRVQCAAVLPIGVLFPLQVSLEDGFEYQNCRSFRNSIADCGHS